MTGQKTGMKRESTVLTKNQALKNLQLMISRFSIASPLLTVIGQFSMFYTGFVWSFPVYLYIFAT